MVLSYALFKNHNSKTLSKPRTLMKTLSLLYGGYFFFSYDPDIDIGE